METLTHNGDAGLPPYANDPLLNCDQVSTRLNISTALLNKWRCTGEGPRYVKLGKKRIAYRLSDINAFVEAGLRRSTSECGAA